MFGNKDAKELIKLQEEHIANLKKHIAFLNSELDHRNKTVNQLIESTTFWKDRCFEAIELREGKS